MRAFVLVLVALPAAAVAGPVELVHQGRLLDASGAGLTGSHDLTVTLWDDPIATAPANRVHTETFPGVQVEAGYYTVTLGSAGDLDAGLLGGDLWVGVAIGGGGELGPRTPLGWAPRAAVADTAWQARRSAGEPFPCTASALEGSLYYDTTAGTLRVCGPSGWQEVGATAGQVGTASNPAANCQDVLDRNGPSPDGTYWVDPDGPGFGINPFQVYCDMTRDGGGWALVYVSDSTNQAQMKTAGAVGAVPASGPVCPGVSAKLSDATIRALWSNGLRFTVVADAAGDMTYLSDTVLSGVSSFSDQCGLNNVVRWYFRRAPGVLSGVGDHPHYCGWSYFGPCSDPSRMCWYGPHEGYKVHMNASNAHLTIPANIAALGYAQGCGHGWVR